MVIQLDRLAQFRGHIVEQQQDLSAPNLQATRRVKRSFKGHSHIVFGHLLGCCAEDGGVELLGGHAESQSMGLTRPMVGILTANDHLDRIGLSACKACQLVARRRVHNTPASFDLHRRINGFQHARRTQRNLRSMLLASTDRQA